MGNPHRRYGNINLIRHVAIVIGNEGSGVREKTMEHCDTLLQIPMTNDVESLNASVTVGIVAYEILKQRAHVIPDLIRNLEFSSKTLDPGSSPG
jgi:23S rRNA (guanosine2251-2'-O)-methyltransferase